MRNKQEHHCSRRLPPAGTSNVKKNNHSIDGNEEQADKNTLTKYNL